MKVKNTKSLILFNSIRLKKSVTYANKSVIIDTESIYLRLYFEAIEALMKKEI